MFFFKWLNQLKILCLKHVGCPLSFCLKEKLSAESHPDHTALRETLTTELFPGNSSLSWDTKMFIFPMQQDPWVTKYLLCKQLCPFPGWEVFPCKAESWVPVTWTIIQISSENDGSEYNSKTGITEKLQIFFIDHLQKLWIQFERANISKTHLEASRVDKDKTLN